MEAKVDQAANEIKRLNACINNLISCSGASRHLEWRTAFPNCHCFARHAAADVGLGFRTL